MRYTKYILATVALLIIVFFGWHYFKTPEVASQPYKEITTIVAFGDSLVEGVGSTKGNDFVSQLSEKIGKPIINEGKRGETSAQGLARIKTVLDEKPDMVIILFGGNDALQRIPKATTFRNIGTMISTFKERGITVVLLGIQGGALSDPYKDEFKKLAKDYKLNYVSNVLDGLFAERQYMSDAVHPNDAGYKEIAERVYAEIKPLFK